VRVGRGGGGGVKSDSKKKRLRACVRSRTFNSHKQGHDLKSTSKTMFAYVSETSSGIGQRWEINRSGRAVQRGGKLGVNSPKGMADRDRILERQDSREK